jgi:hypothetical protein
MIDRWGKGSGTTERMPDTAAAKEAESKLAAMLKERERQDAIWDQPKAKDDSEPKNKIKLK